MGRLTGSWKIIGITSTVKRNGRTTFKQSISNDFPDLLITFNISEYLDSEARTEIFALLNSLEAAKADTSEKLKAYWTQVETESRITNAMDSISLSVYQQAKNYTDGQFQEKLSQYYSKSEIDLKTDSIQLQIYQEYALPNNLLP